MKNLRLAMKLGIGFGVVLALTALLAVGSWSGMTTILDRVDKADGMNDIIKMVLDIRRHEKNYQIRHDQKSQDELAKNVAGIVEKAQAYKARFNDSKNREQMDQVLASTKAYSTAFKNYVDRRQAESALQKTMAAAGLSALASTEALQQALKTSGGEGGGKHGGGASRIDLYSDAAHMVAQIYSMRVAALYFLQTEDDAYAQKVLQIGADVVKMAGELKTRLADKGGIDLAEAVARDTTAYMKSTEECQKAVQGQKEMESQLIQSARDMQKICESARDDMKNKMFSEIALARTLLAIGAMLALVLGVIAALLITRAITGPVRKGLQFAKDLAGGHLDARIDVDQKDEVGALAAALTDMA